MYSAESSVVAYYVSPNAVQFAYGVHLMHNYNDSTGYNVITDTSIDSAQPEIMKMGVIGLNGCRTICEYYRKKYDIQMSADNFINWLLTHDINLAIPSFARTDKCKNYLEQSVKKALGTDKFGNTNDVSSNMDTILENFVQDLFGLGKSSLDAYKYDRNPIAYIRNTFNMYAKDHSKLTKVLNQKTVTDELKENFSKQDIMISQDMSLDIGKCLSDIYTLYNIFFDRTTNPYTLYIQRKHADEINSFIRNYFPALGIGREFSKDESTRRNKWSNRVKLFDYFWQLCEKDFSYVDLLNAYKGAIDFHEGLIKQQSGYALFDSKSGKTQNNYTNDQMLECIYNGLHAIRKLYNFCKMDQNVFLSSCVFEKYELVNAIKSRYVLYYDFDLIATNVSTVSTDLHPTSIVSSALMQNNNLISVIQMIQHVKISEIKAMPTSKKSAVGVHMVPLTLYQNVQRADAATALLNTVLEIHSEENIDSISFDINFATLCLLTSKLFTDNKAFDALTDIKSMYEALGTFVNFPMIGELYTPILEKVSKNEKLTLTSVECNLLLFVRHSYTIFGEYAKVCSTCHIDADGTISKIYLNSFLTAIRSTHEYTIIKKSVDFKFRNIFAFMLNNLDVAPVYISTDLIEFNTILRINAFAEKPNQTVIDVIEAMTPMFVHGYAFDGFNFIKYDDKYIHQTGCLVSAKQGLDIRCEKINEEDLPIIYRGLL